MAGDSVQYLNLITSEHADKPKFAGTVLQSVKPFADITAALQNMPSFYDLDNAVGIALDRIGEWVGVSRYVREPLAGVYFALDTEGVGLDEGVLWDTDLPLTGLTALPDGIYKLLIRARIVANHWDGTIPNAYEVWSVLFDGTGYQILIQDNGDMTMTLGFVTPNVDPVMQQLFIGGYLDLKPAGVLISDYITPSVPGPFFGLDVENSVIAGLDVGSLAISVA
jgi:hypothetical protein